MSGKLIDINKTKSNQYSMVVNKTNDTAEIVLYGYIGDNPWDDSAVSAKQFSDELKKLPENTKNIILRINSGGGSVFDGVTIYERLKAHKAKKTVYIDGIAASIASVIALAGDEIIIGEGGMFMIHRPMSGSFGNNSEHERTIAILDKIEEQMISIYARKTGISRSEISKMLSDETWMTASEALDMGFVTSLTEAHSSLYIAADILAKAKHFKHKPTIDASNMLVKDKLDELKNKITGFQARTNVAGN